VHDVLFLKSCAFAACGRDDDDIELRRCVAFEFALSLRLRLWRGLGIVARLLPRRRLLTPTRFGDGAMSEWQRSDHSIGVSKDRNHRVIDFLDNQVALAMYRCCPLVSRTSTRMQYLAPPLRAAKNQKVRAGSAGSLLWSNDVQWLDG
jgi:hypothetical protein